MATLARDTVLAWRPRGARSYVVKNGVTLYAGALVGTDANGYLDKWLDTAGLKFEGILKEGCVGDTSATPKVEGKVDTSGPVLLSAAVAGATTQASVNAPVFCASDNPADMTLTATTNVAAIGKVVRWISSAVCDVELFQPAETGRGNITVLTAATGTPSSTISDVGGAFSQTTLNNNFKSLADTVNAILAAIC